MLIGHYLFLKDADKDVQIMRQNGEWEDAWIEAHILNETPVYAVYGIAKYPNDLNLINNAYDAY
jgi:hypothetical protein